MRSGWDLAELYRDEMTIRQFWVRVKALPPDSPLAASLIEEREREKELRRADDVDEVLNRYRTGG